MLCVKLAPEAMSELVQATTPLDVPAWSHVILWPALIVWTLILARTRRRVRRSALLLALVPLCFVADLGALAVSIAWPTPASNSFVFAVLWLTVLLSTTTFLVLRAADDGGDDGADVDEPEPPWWPEFERQLRDYTRGPQGPTGDPRTPAGTSA
jgi:hypothetical protein